MSDILLRDVMRMGIGLDGIVFRRKTERIKTDREKDVVALHAALSCEHLDAGICLDMAYVHARSGRIRKFDQSIPFRLLVKVNGLERAGIFPALLPLGFDFKMIVRLLCHCALLVSPDTWKNTVFPAVTRFLASLFIVDASEDSVNRRKNRQNA